MGTMQLMKNEKMQVNKIETESDYKMDKKCRCKESMAIAVEK